MFCSVRSVSPERVNGMPSNMEKDYKGTVSAQRTWIHGKPGIGRLSRPRVIPEFEQSSRIEGSKGGKEERKERIPNEIRSREFGASDRASGRDLLFFVTAALSSIITTAD